MKKLTDREMIIVSAIAVSLVGLFIYGGYRYWELSHWYDLRTKEARETKGVLLRTENYLQEVKNNLAQTTYDRDELREALTAEQAKNQVFESQIRDIAGTVGSLNKLARTDPELLRKYSKVYFLSENYIPAQLTVVNKNYVFDPERTELILGTVEPFLATMLQDAAREGHALKVVSAFRSFGEQAALKYGYKITYGAGTANQFSADQGYSEHQLGTTVDLTTPELKGVFLSFEKSPAHEWLTTNAHRYGFVLSYPKNNNYYQFEPWHWRFVGRALATKLHSENRHFYELSQREINEYLISLFD